MTPFSVNPDQAIEGGLWSAENARIVGAEYLDEYDYNGRAANPATVVHLTLEREGQEQNDEQYWSIGSPEHWAVEDGGRSLSPVNEEQEGLRKGSNAHALFTGLAECGLDAEMFEKITTDISVLEGYVFHWVRKPQQEREFRDEQAEQNRNRTVLVPTKLVESPSGSTGSGSSSSAKKGPAKKAPAKKAPAASSNGASAGGDDEVRQQLTDFITEHINEQGGFIDMSDLRPAVTAYANENSIPLAKVGATMKNLSELGFAVEGDTIAVG